MPTQSNAPETGIRDFELSRDLDAIKRIWQEIGWVEEASEIKLLDHFFACGKTLVGTLDGHAECAVHTAAGDMQLHKTPLALCAVTAVTTSRIARGQAFAQRLTARQLAHGAAEGAAVAALGMFDQGFYDKLGFGTGAYEHSFVLDPGTLNISRKPATPVRLEVDSYEEVHAAMLRRHRVNGSVCLHPRLLMRAELGFSEQGFGLGYRHDNRLTHFVWLEGKGEHGPYRVKWIAYENTEQLLDLLALLKSLADQVYSLEIMEPPEIQLQSLLQRPFRNMALSEKGAHAAAHESFAWWQFRVLDVAACVAAVNGLAADVAFQLELSDPLRQLLADQPGWHGVAGSYQVCLGAESRAAPGQDSTLPKLACSVNALTRLLWCVAPASSLQVTDDFSAPPSLVAQLDALLTFPSPRPGWNF